MRKIALIAARSMKVVAAMLPASMVAFIPASLGVAIAPKEAHAAIGDGAWGDVLANPTAETLSTYILKYPESSYTEEALCMLQDISAETAVDTVGQLKDDYPHSNVDFSTCAATGAARLTNI